MSERVDQAAEGEWPLDELTDVERTEFRALQEQAAALRDTLAAGMPPDLDQAVMRRVRQLGLEPLPPAPRPRAGRGRRVAAALWERREIRFALRPAYALVVLLVLVPVIDRTVTPKDRPVAEAVDADHVFVQFSLRAEGAAHVALAGSFTDWQPLHSLHPSPTGVWTLMLPLEPGVHDYSFIVDGQRWVPDPHAPHVDDGFGGVNSRITLLTAADGT